MALIWVPLFLAVFCAPSLSQEQRRPTEDDLRTVIDDWKQATSPGQILNMNAKVVLLFDERDIKTVEDAKKIGDDKDTCTELISKNRAAAVAEPTQVRLLDTVQVICFAFKNLGLPCNDVPTTLTGLYRETSSSRARGIGQLTEADWKKRQEGLVEMFTKHDLSRFVNDTYALVRVVSGKQSGTKGWVRMSELRPLAPKSRP